MFNNALFIHGFGVANDNVKGNSNQLVSVMNTHI